MAELSALESKFETWVGEESQTAQIMNSKKSRPPIGARPPLVARKSGIGAASNANASARVRASEKKMIAGSIGGGGYDSDSVVPAPTMSAEEMKIQEIKA